MAALSSLGMGRVEVVRCGTDRLRVGPWRGHQEITHVAPLPGSPPSAAAVDACLELLAHQGYREAVTAALVVTEQEPFRLAGFEVVEHLHLLRHDLVAVPSAPPARLRRGRRSDRPRILELDAEAFPPFWRLDEHGLLDALAATPSVRFRVALERRVQGYAVTGRAGRTGYLQRLAVAPGHQGRGLGSALVVDALGWARRRGAHAVLVNTQEHNEGALELYRRLCFQLQEHGLAVMGRPVAPVP